jgi:translation initiation factor 2 subunit 2
MKKKKKKKKERVAEELDPEAVENVTEKMESLPLPSTVGDSLDSTFAGLKKKKKKKPVDGEVEEETLDTTAETNGTSQPPDSAVCAYVQQITYSSFSVFDILK